MSGPRSQPRSRPRGLHDQRRTTSFGTDLCLLMTAVVGGGVWIEPRRRGLMHAHYAQPHHLRQCSLDRRSRGLESEISTFTYVVPLRAL